ncbi:MAG: glycosyltransferase family 1 protein [Candidatus Komeilibacteria bacterium]|nr:glycosyltransferase family 1 protein [Candidatus Komeilibacteria bacterium]
MIIGIDASRANREERTGVEWYSYNLIKELYQTATADQFFLYLDKPLTGDLKPLPINFKEKVLNWPVNRFWTLGRLTLEMIAAKPDVLFVPAHTFPLIGAKRNIITWHDVGYERYPETYTKWELASLKQGARRALKMADKIITISHYTKAEMVKIYGVDPDKITVIYPGCNFSRWQQRPENEVKNFLTEHNLTLPYFIYLGRLTLRKNIIGLIKIYNRFREKCKTPHNLLLVGASSGPQEEIDKEIYNSPYREEIKKIGWLSSEQLALLLCGAQGLVSASFYEGFGLPVIEAMASGVPVIVSNSGSLPEIVGEAGLLISAHEVDEFACQMLAVLENRELRASLIAKGLVRAKEFSWQRCVKETSAVLKG